MSKTITTSNKMPRRPVTAFFLFQGDQNLKGMWNTLSDKDRKKYEALHAKDKIRYEKEKKLWEEAGGENQTEIPQPKQALSVYMWFSKAQKIGEKWRNCSKEVKDEYKKKAKDLLDQYKLDIAAYEDKYGPGVLDAPDWPKRPLAAYMRFAQESRAEFTEAFPDLNTSGIGKKLGAAWHEMTDEERQEYSDAYEADYEKWLEKMDEYEAKYGDVKFIQNARKKARNEESKEAEKKKQQLKREMQREKNKRRREKEVLKEKREKAKLKNIKDKEREKKRKQEEQEKALRRACVFYKKENRPKMKKRFPGLSASEITQQIEEKWNDLVLSTQKSWVRRSQLEKDEPSLTEEVVDVEKEIPKKKQKKTAGKKRAREEVDEQKEEHEEEGQEEEDSTAVEKPAKKAKKKEVVGPTAADLKKALAFYSKQERPKYKKREPDAKAAAINKKIKEKWSTLSDKTRSKYLRQATSAETEEMTDA